MSERDGTALAAHAHSSGHRAEIERSTQCGCFYCLACFPPAEISNWVDPDAAGLGTTALCPRCGIDAVIGAEAGYPLTPEFLTRMRTRWFA